MSRFRTSSRRSRALSFGSKVGLVVLLGVSVACGQSSPRSNATTFDPGSTGQVGDLRYLPDGSGFLFAYRPNLTDTSMNINRFDFESKNVTHLTDGYVVSLSIAPDGKNVVFEVSQVDPLSHPDSPPPDDLWKM